MHLKKINKRISKAEHVLFSKKQKISRMNKPNRKRYYKGKINTLLSSKSPTKGPTINKQKHGKTCNTKMKRNKAVGIDKVVKVMLTVLEKLLIDNVTKVINEI